MLNRLFPCSAGRIFAVMCNFVTRINNNIMKLISLFILSHRLVLFVDINECEDSAVDHQGSGNTECVNTKGSYTCVCKDGFSNDTEAGCKGLYLISIVPAQISEVHWRNKR